jgi:hypothetical protein
MSHLTLTALARLVDETPTALEAAHLQACADCRGELDRLRADVASLAALPDIAPPTHAWHALDARLAAEGLRRTARRPAWFAASYRMAAGIALLAIGTAVGTLVVAPRVHTAPAHVATVPADDDTSAVTAAAPLTTPPAAGDSPGEVADIVTAPPPAASQPRAPVYDVTEPVRGRTRFAANDVPAPRTADEALAWMREAETHYLEALARFAELTGGIAGDDPVARLAALEGIVLTTGAALDQAPADPVINGYHMTALAQREATLRQIATSTAPYWF